MKKSGLARRGLNLGAVRIAMLCDRVAAGLIDYAAPRAQRRVTVADVLAELDKWIGEADRLIADGERQTAAGGLISDRHRRAVITAQVLREFRNFMTREE